LISNCDTLVEGKQAADVRNWRAGRAGTGPPGVFSLAVKLTGIRLRAKINTERMDFIDKAEEVLSVYFIGMRACDIRS
jgi:hypothetical protein